MNLYISAKIKLTRAVLELSDKPLDLVFEI